VRNIVFYRTESGGSPVEDFLNSLSGKQAQRVAWVLRLVEEIDSVPAQYFKKLPGTEDIWEVRVQSGSDTIRCWDFAKKTAKVPPREIGLSERRRRDYINRSKKQ